MGQIVSDVKDILNYEDSKNNAKATKNKILSDMASDETEKQNLVKKVLSAQRAKYGADGRMVNGATEDAVLSRLKTETEKPYQETAKTHINKLKNTKAKKKNILVSVLEHLD